MNETNSKAAELAHLIRCLGHAETLAMRTRTETDYRAAARYARDCAEHAAYTDRESYWRCAARWSAMADSAATAARDTEIGVR